jgi:general secretion pathway protein G
MSRRLTPSPANPAMRGFTLIELLIVMVILGLLAALVGPKLFGHVDQAKVDTTRTQISSLQTALDAFRLDVGRYPTTDEGLSVLRSQPADDSPGASRWHGPYLPRMPKDGWGNDFHYTSPGQHGDYDLLSYGADNKEGGEGNDADVTSWDPNDVPKDAAKP